MDIRIITSEKEISGLLHKFSDDFNPPLSERVCDLDIYAEKLRDRAINAVIEDNGKATGFISFYANDEISKTAYCIILAVEKSFRRRGAGRFLLSYFERIAADKGMEQAKLRTQTYNENAIAMYLANGYRICGYSNDNGVYMIKKLKK